MRDSRTVKNWIDLHGAPPCAFGWISATAQLLQKWKKDGRFRGAQNYVTFCEGEYSDRNNRLN